MIVFTDGQVAEVELRRTHADEVSFLWMANPSDSEIETVLRDYYQCHPLVIEDCIHQNQRPKLDVYRNHAFLPFFYLKGKGQLVELSTVIGDNYLIVISPETLPFATDFQTALMRLDPEMHHAGYIMYRFLDECVNGYFEFSDTLEERITQMEHRLYKDPFASIAQGIFKTKRKLHQLRRIFSEERNAIGSLMHAQFPYTAEFTTAYFMDVFDHLNRMTDVMDSLGDALTGLLEMQMSMKSDRMNEIMKTLTVVSTFFMPLSFIVGLYGMNLKIPEYGWKYGYVWAWGWIILVTAGMWIYFKRKKWF